MSTPDTFSVVIPTHDRAAAVTERVTGVLAAEGAPEQIVVVADGCTDDTVARLAALGDERLTVASTTGLGPASARNVGAGAATGRWLVFLDDDDLPEATWMATWRELAALHPHASYLSSACVQRLGTVDTLRRVRPLGPAFSDAAATYMPGTFAVRADAFERSGGYLDGLRFLECTELAVRLFDQLADDPDAFASSTTSTIARIERPPGARHAMRPDIKVPSSRIAHEAMRPFLERDPSLYANSLGALGVAEMRLGDRRAGRRTLRRAARADLRQPRHLARAVVAHVPLLCRAVWR